MGIPKEKFQMDDMLINIHKENRHLMFGWSYTLSVKGGGKRLTSEQACTLHEAYITEVYNGGQE